MITSVQVLVEVNNWAALVPVGQVYHTRFDEWPYEDVLSLPLLCFDFIAFGTFHVLVFVMTSSALLEPDFLRLMIFFKIQAVYTSSGVTVKSVPLFRDYQLF
jgi:hypothetical protein